MKNIAQVLSIEEKLACITLDFEFDYGNRVKALNTLRYSRQGISDLADLFAVLNVPVSAFIVTQLLEQYPASFDIVKQLATDYHCHSHSHNIKDFDSAYEIPTTASVFENHFGYRPLGYRAPLGVLYNNDINLLKEYGFKFSSSVFPSWRFGRFNNLDMPISPFLYENGLLEIPLAVVPKVRYIVSLSYLRLAGFAFNSMLFSIFNLPNVLIFDSHLFDFIFNEESFRELPLKMRLAWGRNRHSGVSYFTKFVEILKRKNFRFVTITELYHYLEAK